METLIYCSGCDRNVRAELIHPPDPALATDPSAFVCLECGDHCSGSFCPVTTVPTQEMKLRLATRTPASSPEEA